MGPRSPESQRRTRHAKAIQSRCVSGADPPRRLLRQDNLSKLENRNYAEPQMWTVLDDYRQASETATKNALSTSADESQTARAAANAIARRDRPGPAKDRKSVECAGRSRANRIKGENRAHRQRDQQVQDHRPGVHAGGQPSRPRLRAPLVKGGYTCTPYGVHGVRRLRHLGTLHRPQQLRRLLPEPRETTCPIERAHPRPTDGVHRGNHSLHEKPDVRKLPRRPVHHRTLHPTQRRTRRLLIRAGTEA